MNDTDILILAFWIAFWSVIALLAIGVMGFVTLIHAYRVGTHTPKSLRKMT